MGSGTQSQWNHIRCILALKTRTNYTNFPENQLITVYALNHVFVCCDDMICYAINLSDKAATSQTTNRKSICWRIDGVIYEIWPNQVQLDVLTGILI